MSTENSSSFGEHLKQARKASNLSQTALAERIGVSPSVISSYETGAFGANRNRMTKLATELGVSLSYLLGETSNPSEPQPGELNLHPKIQEQAKALMDEEGFTELRELVVYLIKEETKRRGTKGSKGQTLADSMEELHQSLEKTFGKKERKDE